MHSNSRNGGMVVQKKKEKIENRNHEAKNKLSGLADSKKKRKKGTTYHIRNPRDMMNLTLDRQTVERGEMLFLLKDPIVMNQLDQALTRRQVQPTRDLGILRVRIRFCGQDMNPLKHP